ncbi:MAG: HAD family hydrolase [Promethearchaeota archaeon]
MTNFNVIFFNAGGTLIQLKNTTIPILYSEFLSRKGKQVSPEEVYQAFRKAESWILSRKRPGALFTDLDQRKYQNVFYNQLGIRKRNQINQIEKLIAENLELKFSLEKDALRILRYLKSSYQLGIISNWDESLIEILDDLAILDYFDSITFSGEVGVNKPDLEIFRSALEEFPNVKPKETAYIGDDYITDIIPAQKLKMFAILFDKGPSGMHGRPFQTDVKCTIIRELAELPEILNKHVTVHK